MTRAGSTRPDNYIGKGYYLWGCIFQFDAATGPKSILANASYTKQYWSLDGELPVHRHGSP